MVLCECLRIDWGLAAFEMPSMIILKRPFCKWPEAMPVWCLKESDCTEINLAIDSMLLQICSIGFEAFRTAFWLFGWPAAMLKQYARQGLFGVQFIRKGFRYCWEIVRIGWISNEIRNLITKSSYNEIFVWWIQKSEMEFRNYMNLANRIVWKNQ